MKKLPLYILVFCICILAGCGGTKKRPTIETKPVSIKTFDTPPGGDPSVSAELGGEGFKGEGWQTADNYNSLGSPNAVKGGMIRLSIPDFPATLRLVGKDENSYYTRMAQKLMYESMLGTDPVTEEPVPQLATHWQVSEDKLTYKFRINPNARWADGKPVVADDYVATFKLLKDPGILSGTTNDFYTSYFEQPVAESKYIVSVKAKQVGWIYFDAAAAVRIMPAHIIGSISGKDYLEKFQYDVVPGSGPYTILKEDILKGQSITLRRRSDYWGENEKFSKGLNNFDFIKTEVNQDATIEFEKLKKGDIDLVQVNSAQRWAEQTNFEDVQRGVVQKKRIYNQNPGGLSGIAMNMRKAPFDDIKIRRAFQMLFDRQKFNEKLFFNSYTPTKSFFSATVYENPNNELVKYNFDEAVKLLAEAGWSQKNSEGYLIKDGKVFELDLPFSGGPGQERYLTVFQEDLKRAGIKLNLKAVDGTTNFQLGNERNFTILMINWGGQNPPNLEFGVLSKTADDPNSTNWPGFKNTRVDEITAQYNVTFDKKERVKQAREVDSLLVAMQPYVFGWYADYARLIFQNRFGYPDWYLSRFDDYLGSTEFGVPSMWYIDPEKEAVYQEALKDKSKKMDVTDVDSKYWLDIKAREEKGEKVTLAGNK